MHSKTLLVPLTALCFAAAFNLTSAPIPEEYKQGSFFIGCQAYTFKEFPVLEAIERTAHAGGRVIELFPGQKFSKDDAKLKFDHAATDEMVAKVKAKLDEKKVKAANYGVVFGNNANPTEEEWRKVFDFAKKMDIGIITTEAEKSIDVIEKLVKEYDIAVAFHNHPKTGDEGYKMWDPNHVAQLVKGRDTRVGASADTGHWARSGLKPTECLQILRGRLVSCHLKDLAEFGKREAKDAPYGTGVCDVPGILNELKDQGFSGNISIEYESNWQNNVPEVAQCVGYVRGFGQAKNW